MSTSRKKTLDFEQSLQRLNELIEKMETGQLNLDTSLQHFEEGIALIRHCQQALSAAEQKVRILTEKNDKTTLVDFDVDEK